MTSSKKSLRADARHEAAHAVVSVRLGLPLASTDIHRRTLAPDNDVSHSRAPGVSTGFTTLIEGTTERWQRALPDPEARQNLEKYAAQCAAGAVGEGDLYSEQVRDDWQGVVQVAGVLGIGTSSTEPAVGEFMRESLKVAAELLLDYDDGAAWDRVTAALLRKRSLTGDTVRELVAASDATACEER